jgi:GTPase involved in cell partitioning and DNA repair
VGEVKIEKVVDADPMVGTKTVAQLNWKILEVNTFKNNLPSRVIGEVSRKIDLDTQDYLKSFHKKIQEQGEAFAQDLIAQLTEMWSRGTLGANVVQIRLMRHLPIENLEKIKNSLIAITRDIKTVKERRITSNYVVFEVETSASAESLGSKLQRVDLSGYKFVLQNVQNNELFFRFIQ